MSSLPSLRCYTIICCTIIVPYADVSHTRSLLPSPDTSSPDNRAQISLKTNVNRKKTKRWVEAKKISYDGDDWGDDEYGEYDNDEVEEDETPPPPMPPSLNTQRGTSSTNTSSPSPSSMERPHLERPLRSDSPASASGRSRSGGDSSTPFVRPAEIYKRMREEKQKQITQNNSQSPQRNAEAHASEEQQQQQQQQQEEEEEPEMPTAVEHPDPLEHLDRPTTPKKEELLMPKGLPEIKRVSAFDTTFLGTDETASQEEQQDVPERQLQHNPSMGFRSAVDQAFDEDMPTSSVDSLARSNSDSTSNLSPIITTVNRGGLQDESKKEQTIVEEPGENASPSPPSNDNTERPIAFKPGHRRDWSLPSSDKSASRKPEVHESDEDAPRSVFGDLSSTSPDSPYGVNTTTTTTPKSDLPAPLRLASNSTEQQQQHSDMPRIIPTYENSRQDGDNERLREEIMLSLSRENSPGREEAPVDYSSSHLAGQTFTAVGQHPPELPPREVESGGYQQQQQPPLLKRRFSWESSSSEDSDVLYGGGDGSQPQATQNREQPETGQEGNVKPGLVINTGSAVQSKHDLHEVEPEPVDEPASSASYPEASPTAGPVVLLPQQVQRPPRTSEKKQTILGFKDILHIKHSPERIRAFERTRDQYAAIDTGLNEWIGSALDAHPEYTDLVEQNEQFAAANQKLIHPKGGKFPRLPSLGNFASHLDVPGTGSSSPRRNNSSSLGSQRRGKEILHTAGVLGGKAGDAA